MNGGSLAPQTDGWLYDKCPFPNKPVAIMGSLKSRVRVSGFVGRDDIKNPVSGLLDDLGGPEDSAYNGSTHS